MTFRESDGCIVPMKLEDQSGGTKPGNAGVGKAARLSRDSDRTSAVLSYGHTVLTRLGPSSIRKTSDGWEPDAGKRHVRICEGPAVRLDMVEILRHHQRKQVDNRKLKP